MKDSPLKNPPRTFIAENCRFREERKESIWKRYIIYVKNKANPTQVAQQKVVLSLNASGAPKDVAPYKPESRKGIKSHPSLPQVGWCKFILGLSCLCENRA